MKIWEMKSYDQTYKFHVIADGYHIDSFKSAAEAVYTVRELRRMGYESNFANSDTDVLGGYAAWVKITK